MRFGTIQPIRGSARELETIRKFAVPPEYSLPLYLHTDACQAANYLDLHVHRLGVDLMTLNGGKIYGPKQSGALFAASHVALTPAYPRWRPGTRYAQRHRKRGS